MTVHVERDPAYRPRDLADWQEYVTERAAIFEFCGGLSRDEADRCARVLAGPAPEVGAAPQRELDLGAPVRRRTVETQSARPRKGARR